MTITTNELLHIDAFVINCFEDDSEDDLDDEDMRSGNYTLEDMHIATTTNPAYREALLAQRKARQDQAVHQRIQGLEPVDLHNAPLT